MNNTSGIGSDCLSGPSHSQQSVVMCKWQPVLARELLTRTRVHVVLDEYDILHGGVDESLLSNAISVHTVSSFNALEELATVAVSIQMQDPNVAKVASYTEFSQLGAGYIAEFLGVGSSIKTSVTGRDKRLMKRAISARGIPTAAFYSLPDPTDEVAVTRLSERLEYPVVVKPAAGFGTIGTHLIQDSLEFTEICRSFSFDSLLSSRHLTVESFVAGQELHIDGYWGANRPEFLFVSRYFAPRLAVQRGEVRQDGGELLSREEHPELYAEVEQMLGPIMQGIGVTETMIHLEMFRQADGRLVFSEIGTRVGGGWAPSLVSQALGRSLWTAFADMLIDGRTQPPCPAASHLGILHVKPDTPGRIVRIPSVQEATAVPGVLGAEVWRKSGDVVTLKGASEWIMFVVFGAETREEFEVLAKEIPERLRVVTATVEEV